jgi:hypothetical protein
MAAGSLPLRVDRGSLTVHRGGSESIHLVNALLARPAGAKTD